MTTEVVWLRSERLAVGIDRRTGALIALIDDTLDWDVLGRPELGLGFRLLVPLPGRRNNPVHSADQDAPRVSVGDDRVVLSWTSVRSVHGGLHAIGVEQRLSLTDDGLRIETTIDNRSELVVENVFSPYLGDVQPVSQDGRLWAIRHDYGSGMKQQMWPVFENSVGYYGVDVPTQLAQKWMPGYGAPFVPYTLIQSDGAGLYIGVADDSSELVAWHAELWPGYGDSLESHVPETREIAGVPVRVQFAAVHVPFIAPGATRELTPIEMTVYAGDWHAGAEVYARWRNSWLDAATVPDWASEPHTWLQLQVNSPEDDLRIDFDELIEVGREAARAGVSAIQLVGFNTGGQDRNNPSHEPDARLGGADGLRRAIAAIQEMGVKVVLFAKFTWADRSTPEFRNRFIKEAVKDPYGDYYLHPGYRYETVTQVLDINTRRLIPMCFLSESYLDECVRQFDTLVALGADGILFDECMHHMPTLLCFDTEHGHRSGAPTYGNDRELIRRFRSRLGDRDDFLFAGEAIYDWQFETFALSYHRSENRHHFPLHRFVAPHQQMMTAVTGFDDRNMVNQSLVYRYVLSFEPYNFKGRLPDFPDTVAYGNRMQQLRLDARKWVWDGTFRDTIGARVTRPDGSEHHPYSVFEASDGSRAVTVANYDRDPVTVLIGGLHASAQHEYRAVDDDGWRMLAADGAVELQPRSAAVVRPRSERGGVS